MKHKTIIRIITFVILSMLPMSSQAQNGRIAYNRGIKQFANHQSRMAGNSFVNAFLKDYFPSSEALEMAALSFHINGNNDQAKQLLFLAEEEALYLFYLAKSDSYKTPYDSINKPPLAGEVLYDSLYAFYSRTPEYEFLFPDLLPYTFAFMYEETEIYDSAIYYSDISLKYELDEELLVVKGNAYLGLSQPDSAAKYFQQALEIDSLNTSAILGIAEFHEYRNEFKLALQNIEKALAIDSTDSYVLNLHCYILMEMKEYSKAITSAEKILSTAGGDYFGYYVKGDIYFEMEEYQKAIKAYEKFLEFEPGDEDALYNIDAAHYNLNLDFEDCFEPF